MVGKFTPSANMTVGAEIVARNYNLIYETSLATATEYFNSKGGDWLDPFHAEECTDLVIEFLLEKGERFEESKSSLKSYVKMKTRNICGDYYRSYKHFEPIEMEDEDGDTYERAECSTRITPIDEVIGWEKGELLDEYLDSKSDLDKEVMSLYMEGYQPKEIGEKLSLTAEAVALRVFKMKKALVGLGLVA